MSKGISVLDLPNNISPDPEGFVHFFDAEGNDYKVNLGDLMGVAMSTQDLTDHVLLAPNQFTESAERDVYPEGVISIMAVTVSAWPSVPGGASGYVVIDRRGDLVGFSAASQTLRGESASYCLQRKTAGEGLDFSGWMRQVEADESGDVLVSGDLSVEGVSRHSDAPDLSEDEASVNVGMLRDLTQYATTFSRLDQAGVVFSASGGTTSSNGPTARNAPSKLDLNVRNSPSNVLAAARIIDKLPSASGFGLRPFEINQIAEFVVDDGTGQQWPDVSAWLILGSSNSNPQPPSASEQGIAIKSQRGMVSVVSSDGSVLNSSNEVARQETLISGFINYRLEVDGTEARLYRRINDEVFWVLLASVTHPTVNQRYDQANAGMSALIQYEHGSGAGGSFRHLCVLDAKAALINPRFL